MATTAAAMAGNMEPDDQLYNEAVELDHAWMKHFVRGRVFDQAPNTNEQEGASAGQAEQMPKIESLDFHQSEQLMVSVTTDAAIRVYDTKEGTQVKSFFSTKYGAASVQFAHHPNCIIYASSRFNNPAESDTVNNAIRYHSLYDNTYIRYFKVRCPSLLPLILPSCGRVACVPVRVRQSPQRFAPFPRAFSDASLVCNSPPAAVPRPSLAGAGGDATPTIDRTARHGRAIWIRCCI